MSETTSDNQVVHTDTTFRIIGPKHPHRGERCHTVGKDADHISTIGVLGETQYLVKLLDCPHGTERCYVTRPELEMLRPIQEPTSRRSGRR